MAQAARAGVAVQVRVTVLLKASLREIEVSARRTGHGRRGQRDLDGGVMAKSGISMTVPS